MSMSRPCSSKPIVVLLHLDSALTGGRLAMWYSTPNGRDSAREYSKSQTHSVSFGCIRRALPAATCSILTHGLWKNGTQWNFQRASGNDPSNGPRLFGE